MEAGFLMLTLLPPTLTGRTPQFWGTVLHEPIHELDTTNGKGVSLTTSTVARVAVITFHS